MPSLIRATAKALARVAGPAGAPIEFAVSLYDDERSEKRNAALVNSIVQGHALTKEAIREIFEVKEDYSALREQLVSGFQVVVQLLTENHEFLRSLKADQTQISDMAIIPLTIQNQQRFAATEFLTERKVIDELTYLYPSTDYFLSVVYPVGFPQGVLPQGAASRVAHFNFVTALRGCSNQTKASIYSALSNDKPGSDILRAAASLYQEASVK